jgi:hypothetical protein
MWFVQVRYGTMRENVLAMEVRDGATWSGAPLNHDHSGW